MNIFVGNLSFSSTEADVKKLFEGFGSVASFRIVMGKKGTKSRGFGFVEIPDDQQAQAAIAALNGKEFMGRTLNVSPARPKPEVERDKGEAKKIRLEIKVKGRERPREGGGEKRWYNPVFNKKSSGYKTGRRSLSFMKRHAASAIAGHKPRKKAEGESRPWKKPIGEPKPFKREEGEFKPWRKSARSESKPWRNSGKRPRPRQSQVESRRKPGGYIR